MGKKAEEMKELMGHLNEFGPKRSLSQAEKEARRPLPPDILIDAKQDRIHTEKIKKRIVFRKK